MMPCVSITSTRMTAFGIERHGEAGFRVTKTVRETLERAGTKMSVVVRVGVELVEGGEAPGRLGWPRA